MDQLDGKRKRHEQKVAIWTVGVWIVVIWIDAIWTAVIWIDVIQTDVNQRAVMWAVLNEAIGIWIIAIRANISDSYYLNNCNFKYM